MAAAHFYYFGDDEAFFKTLQGEFKQLARMEIKIERIYESEEAKIQSLFLKVFRLRPSCIFIDFSKQTQDYLHLARVISRTPLEHSLVTVGLVDYLSPPEVLRESIATGVDLTFIKSAESSDIVFDVIKLMAPDQIGEHGFANASLKEESIAGIPLKVGFIYNEGFHFETNHRLAVGDKIKIDHHWTTKKIVPSKEVIVTDVQNTNLFYQFKYGVDVNFLFMDEYIPSADAEASDVTEKTKTRDEYVIYHQKQLLKWLKDNSSNSLEKKAKVLVIDHDFQFYQNQARTDKHAYTIRCVPYLEDIGMDLDRYQPQVIAYALDKEGDDPKNTPENLARLIEASKVKFPDGSPFIIIFNSKVSSKELQDLYQYPHLMSSADDLSVDLMLRMADIFDKKMGQLQAVVKTKQKNEHKVFIKKNFAASVSEILIPITIIKISESDMIFQSDTPLEEGMNLRITHPVEFYVNVRLLKSQSKTPQYQGLIHCLGEESKKELRRYVNAIFFRDHDAQINAEVDEFKKLNEEKLLEKQEAEKIENDS